MITRPESEEVLTRRMLPAHNADRQDRAWAWAEWQSATGEQVLTRFIRAHNNTAEADDDLLQETLLTAYLGVESGRYQPHDGVPFTGYVVGIARNKIREARRRMKHRVDLDEEQQEAVLDRAALEVSAFERGANGQPGIPATGSIPRQPEHAVERREAWEHVRSGLTRLPSARRQVIEHFLAGDSTDEIASRMAMSEALVRQHKCRGLRALQRDLQSTGLLSRAY